MNKKLVSLSIVLALAASTVLNVGAALAAGAASLHFVGGGTSQVVGSNFSVAVYENSGATPVNVVTAKVSYDPSKLEFVSIDPSGSAFDFEGPKSGGGGAISLNRGLYGGTVTGDKKVASIVFKTLAGSGTSAISFANGSVIKDPNDSATNQWDGNANGTSFTLTTPAAPPQSTPPAQSAPASNPSPAPSTTKKSATTGSNKKVASATTSPAPAVAGESTPAPAPATTSTEKKDDKSKDADKADAKKNSRDMTWVLLSAILLGVVLYRVRNRRAVTPATPAKKADPKKTSKRS